MSKPFEQVADEFMKFSLATFVNSTSLSCLQHLKTEIKEVEFELNFRNHQTEELIVEYADCICCILSSAAREGISIGQLVRAFTRKLEINKARTWKENPDKTYSHVKEPA